VQPSDLGQPGKGDHLAVAFNVQVARGIALLLAVRRPTAIPRFVVAVIINAIDAGPSARTLAHIKDEILEPRPPIADGNAATPIPWVMRVLGVVATGAHVLPRLVLRRVAHSVLRVAMSQRMLYNGFADHAVLSACSEVAGWALDALAPLRIQSMRPTVGQQGNLG
jgi:hypothetical protein